MKGLTTTRIVGGSLIVTIPKEIVREKSLSEGQIVEIEVTAPKKDFFGTLKGAGKFKKEDELKGQLEE